MNPNISHAKYIHVGHTWRTAFFNKMLIQARMIIQSYRLNDTWILLASLSSPETIQVAVATIVEE